MKKVLIVDDHDIIIDGLKAMLLDEKEIEVVGQAMNGQAAIEMIDITLPDVIIMDISMPIMNGIEATPIIKEKHPSVKIIILTQHESKEYVLQLLKSGADGYLLKNSKKEELLNAIETVCESKKYLGNKISELMLNNLIEGTEKKDEENPEDFLTKREVEIIKLLANDKSNQQVADKLNISLRTVETHRRNIMQKLNLKSAVALVRFAIKHNYIDI